MQQEKDHKKELEFKKQLEAQKKKEKKLHEEINKMRLARGRPIHDHKPKRRRSKRRGNKVKRVPVMSSHAKKLHREH